jgi:putative zinc finger/helix-turn-helix YgiT family protein
MEKTMVRKSDIGLTGEQPGECPNCGGADFTSEIVDQSFEYGIGEDKISLNARFPVWRCRACEFSMAGEEAEAARTNSICNHLGLLSPTQIFELRKSFGLSQQAFSQLTDIGEATIKRWEQGTYLQTKAHDNFLRLISDSDGLVKLQRIQREREAKQLGSKVAMIAARFRCIRREDFESDAEKFKLG